MLDLLKWRAHPERINDSLSKLKEIDGSEIVKVGSEFPLCWISFFRDIYILSCVFFKPHFPCVCSSCRTPWTLCLASWMKVLRDTDSKCLTPWWVTFSFQGPISSVPPLVLSSEEQNVPHRSHKVSRTPSSFKQFPNQGVFEQNRTENDSFVYHTLEKLPIFAENVLILRGFCIAFSVQDQPSASIALFCSACLVLYNKGEHKRFR